MESNHLEQGARRVREHRHSLKQEGLKRCEVNIPSKDEVLIKTLAKILKQNDQEAQKVRKILASALPVSSQDIVSFFQQSPLAEFAEESDFSRDKDTGRPALDF